MKQSQLLRRKIFIVDKCNDPMNVTIWASWEADKCHKQKTPAKKAQNDSKRLRGKPETPSKRVGHCNVISGRSRLGDGFVDFRFSSYPFPVVFRERVLSSSALQRSLFKIFLLFICPILRWLSFTGMKKQGGNWTSASGFITQIFQKDKRVT